MYGVHILVIELYSLLTRGQNLRTALSLVRVERELEGQTRANYVTIRSLCALAMPQAIVQGRSQDLLQRGDT